MRRNGLETRGSRGAAALLAAFIASAMMPSPLLALSEIQKEAAPTAPGQPAAPQTSQPAPSSDNDTAPPATAVPAPAPLKGAPSGGGEQSEPEQVQPANPNESDVTRPQLDPNAPLPEIFYDLSKLPEPVRQMHDALYAACKSGDIEKLRPLLTKGEQATQLSLGEMEGDPIDFLHQLSGDSDGQEILAIMEEILDAGYVHLNAGKPDEVYVWPYFFAIPLAKLTAPQRVELYRIITAGDYEDMKSIGAYIFYRLGITPQGKWAFFLAGD